MIRNIRNRFPAARWLRILGWTSVTMAWATAAVARVVAATPPEPAPPAEPQPVVAPATTAPESIPLLPGHGLVVLRSTPTPTPEPEVVVVAAPAAGTASATVARSSGS